MKRTFYLLIIPLLLAACTQKPDEAELTDWQFEYKGQWYAATIPGFVHTDLMAHGFIPDPYYATNEDSARWVADSAWHYLALIGHSRLAPSDSIWLIFEGLAGRVSIRGAGSAMGTLQHDNMFTRVVYSIPADCDTVHLYFQPLCDSMAEAEYGIRLPDRRAFTRIAPYQQGWDWGPKLPTYGIWKRVLMSSRRPQAPRPTATAERWNVELHQDPDSIGQSFTFYRDGKPLFVKGANWIPVHSFPVLDEAQKQRYRLLLCSAKEAGFNMLRVWGGGIYEHDYFYALCDSLGLMVWQDFNFSTMPYPDNPAMLASIRHEVYENVARIAQHPCVVLWCGNNEVKNGWEDWGWQGVYHWTDAERARLEHAMDTLFGYPSTTSNQSSTSILAQAVRDCDPMQRPYITTSPLYGWGHPECTTHGDSHYWGVWWGELSFEMYKEKTGRFMSEYGFQSYPMGSSLRQFCPTDQLAITSPTLRNHQKHGRGLAIIDKAMQQYYGFTSQTLDLDDFVYVSQLLQAWGTGYGILCHLADPRCSGTLYWQLNDCWPVASWSSIDYYGNWKALHYRAQALFADTVDLEAWQRYYAVYPKQHHYDEARYSLQVVSHNPLTVRLQAETDLYDLYLDTEPHINGHFERNFVDLPAGEELTTHFIPAQPTDIPNQVQITVRTLNDIYSPKPAAR